MALLEFTFNDYIGIEILFQKDGVCEAQIQLDSAKHLNSLGWVHGGILLTTLDSVMGYAVGSLIEPEKDEWTATTQISYQFINAAKPDALLKGIGKVVKFGKKNAFIEGEIYDDEGTLIAKSHGIWAVKRK